jgi:hypothetical protein
MSSHIRAPALGRHPSPLPLATFMFYGGAAGGDKSHMERCDAARVLPVPPRSSPAQEGAFTEVSPGPAASKRKGRPTHPVPGDKLTGLVLRLADRLEALASRREPGVGAVLRGHAHLHRWPSPGCCPTGSAAPFLFALRSLQLLTRRPHSRTFQRSSPAQTRQNVMCLTPSSSSPCHTVRSVKLAAPGRSGTRVPRSGGVFPLRRG